jgi:2-polyprenyl-3-methyl-5-hydroxy-6-metoxy-1,4-benzoquinol methylase
MLAIKDAARNVVRRRRVHQYRPEAERGDPELRGRIDAFGEWFQNYDLNGTPTKLRSIVGEPLDFPLPHWEQIFRPYMPNVVDKTVLDIGCNAGFYSVEVKRLGAKSVLGVDVSQGRSESFIDQAKFAAAELNVDVEFRTQDYRELPDEPFDVVLFLGVLYHLDDPIAGLKKAAALAKEAIFVETRCVPDRRLILEHRVGGFDGDDTSPWAPSPSLVDAMLRAEGFTRLVRPPGNRRIRHSVVGYRS